MSSTRRPLSEQDEEQFKTLFNYAKDWCGKHQWQVGVAEIAFGAGLIALGVENGVIEMGTDLVAIAIGDDLGADILGGTGGTFLGVLPGLLVKSIGIAGMGTAIGVPAFALMGGGALILGLAGYGAGTLIEEFLNPLPSMADFTGAASLTLVGTALMVDGARRIADDDAVRGAATTFKNGVLNLGKVHAARVFATVSELTEYLDLEVGAFLKDLATDPKAFTGTAVLTAGGLGAGSLAATGSVTVLGSQTLGGFALSLGLVSAPVWPIIAGGGLALAAAYVIWRINRPNPPGSPPELPQMQPLRLAPPGEPKSS